MSGGVIRDHESQVNSKEEPGIDPRELLRAVQEYKWIIAGIALAVTVVGLLWTANTPKVYEATCSVEYDPDPSKPLGGEVEDVADPIGSFWTTREFFQTQNMVIASRGVAERVVRKLGLHEDP